MESMLARAESKDIYVKLGTLLKSMGETDIVIKEKFEKFLKGSPKIE